MCLSPTRSKTTLERHSGLIQIDFDKVDKPTELKELLSKDQYSLVVFLSPTGTGVKAVVQIPTCEKDTHERYFEALQKYYSDHYGLRIDEKCRDVSRLFFYSLDISLFVNPYAPLFANIIPIMPDKPKPASQLLSKDTYAEVEIIVNRIIEEKVNIAPDYNEWIKVGFALVSEFGERGRQFFINLSAFYMGEATITPDEQYNKCLKDKGGSKVTIKSFFHIAKAHGIDIKIAPTKPPKVVLQNTSSKTEGKTSKPQNLFMQVEQYLNENYDFRYNEISNEVEVKTKSETFYLPCNENNIYTEPK